MPRPYVHHESSLHRHAGVPAVRPHLPAGLDVLGIFRRCRRCGVWRSIGNFNHGKSRTGQPFVAHTCRRRCQQRDMPALCRVHSYTITDAGRRALREAGL